MKRRIAAYVAVVASLAASSCERAPSIEAPAAPAVSAKTVKATSFTFTKIPPGFADVTITSPTLGLDLIVFQMDAVRAGGLAITEFGFMINSAMPAGSVTNYRLLYYPKGLGKPAVDLGTNAGTNWLPPGADPSTFIRFPLATPLTIPSGNDFTAVFALRADVTGTGPFMFQPGVSTCTIFDGTVAKDVAWFGGDLPLFGNAYHVN